MSASMMDTAEMPATPPVAILAPLEDVARVGGSEADVRDVDSEHSRAARRRERQQRRRQRRLYATLGVAALASVLGATIYVVDVVR